MSTREEIAELIDYVAKAFPVIRERSNVEIWHSSLKGYTLQELTSAALKTLEQKSTCPTLADLKGNLRHMTGQSAESEIDTSGYAAAMARNGYVPTYARNDKGEMKFDGWKYHRECCVLKRRWMTAINFCVEVLGAGLVSATLREKLNLGQNWTSELTKLKVTKERYLPVLKELVAAARTERDMQAW